MTRRPLLCCLFVVHVALPLLYPGAVCAGDDAYAALRADMVRTIARHARFAEDALGRPEIDPKVLEVIGSVPRHAFLPQAGSAPAKQAWWRRLFLDDGTAAAAYADRPIPIGYGQTMSQPFIVALMTDLLQTRPDHVVLEIGTGSGYQAAVLSPLVSRVCTIEIIPQLGRTATDRLAELGFDNVRTKIGDGYDGWPDCGPFDGIVVTAAASHIPPPLVRQLKPGGRMVIPVGPPFAVQHLTLVYKDAAGAVTTRQLLPVAFVPFRRATQ
jgi:protein-L-isoaspartate(D-aspartate) O-methyltransferase